MVNTASDPEEKAQRLALWNIDTFKMKSNAILIDVPQGTEEMFATSFTNEENRKVVLNLAQKLVHAGLSKPEDIVILVGYAAQWRLYIKDLQAT
ncbi:uncharacterized protein N7511_001671 [Penicillium nucicola]|uniref:uncharacterized protein n=1 Tax=Penicillium nucicola TaxID=1850975 RepID=UPI002545A625|nr:uncharacterized protein N7511_001671 [Penicillium nucicola]KAJ5776660.1 hypothetical protein N7511_001671 [Penicillium nucicola]